MKTCIIAQFPPPIHGLSKAVDTLYNSPLKDEFEFSKINLTDNKKFISNVFKLLRNKSQVFYLTLSQSRMGNLRDLVILKIIQSKRAKCIVHLHGGYYREMVDKELPKWQRDMNFRAVSRVDRAIVLSDSLRYIFKDMLPEERIYVVANCVDDQYMNMEPQQAGVHYPSFENDTLIAPNDTQLVSQKDVLHTEVNNQSDSLQNKEIGILYLSNFIESKGYRDVLQMALLEKNERRGYHFNFAGAFPTEDERLYFENFISENDLQDMVTYFGVVTGQKKRDLLSENDIFVLLTRYPKEGQPISILEAMGNGLAIIATAHAAIPDLVKEGINGMLVPKNYSIARIYNQIQTMNLEKIAKVNRSEIVNNYTEKNYIDNMRSAFIFN